MSVNQGVANREHTVSVPNGWFMLVLLVGALLADVALLVTPERTVSANGPRPRARLRPRASADWPAAVGFFTLQPNEARVLVLFGALQRHGARERLSLGEPVLHLRAAGVRGGGPGGSPCSPRRAGGKSESDRHTAASARPQQDLAARPQLNSEKLKVNDKRGNPIEIAAVVVWRVAGHGAGACSTSTTTRPTCRSRASRRVRHLASQLCLRPRRRRGRDHAARRTSTRSSRALRASCRSGSRKAGVDGRSRRA